MKHYLCSRFEYRFANELVEYHKINSIQLVGLSLLDIQLRLVEYFLWQSQIQLLPFYKIWNRYTS